MPTSTSSVQGLARGLADQLALGPDPETDMRRIDRSEIDAVCRHLLGAALEPAAARGATGTRR